MLTSCGVAPTVSRQLSEVPCVYTRGTSKAMTHLSDYPLYQQTGIIHVHDIVCAVNWTLLFGTSRSINGVLGPCSPHCSDLQLGLHYIPQLPGGVWAGSLKMFANSADT
jgi:hypothetical protein